MRLVPCRPGGVALIDLERGTIHALAGIGGYDRWHPPRTPLSHALRGHAELAALREGSAFVEDDLEAVGPTAPILEGLRREGLRSFALVPLVHQGRLTGSIFLGSDAPAAFRPGHVEVAREVADHLAIAIRQSLLLDEVRAAGARLEVLSRQLIRARGRRAEADRPRAPRRGRPVAHRRQDRPRPPRPRPGGGRRRAPPGAAAATVGRALEQVRDLSRLLRPSLLDDLGLAEALRALVEGLAGRAGLAAEAEVDEVGRVDPEAETACYRIAQEALTNAVKHAGAVRLRVEPRRLGDDLELVVDDDGDGFDVAAATARAARGASLGMLGLRERAALAGGRAEVTSGPGRGTRVRAVVPASGRAAGLVGGGEVE